MKKSKRLLVIIIAVLIINSGVFALEGEFKFYLDVFGHWAQDTIMWATNEVGLFVGYEDGTFKPDDDIRVSEYITILYRAAKLQEIINDEENISNDNPIYYEDVNNSYWGYDEIVSIANYIDNNNKEELSFKDIFPGSELKPNRPITREEVILLTYLFTTPAIEDKNLEFKDIDVNYKYHDKLYSLVNNGVIEGYPDRTFKPKNNITRSEAASIIKRTYLNMEYLKSQLLQDIDLINPPKYRKYLAFGNYEEITPKEEDHLYRRAVATLEYRSIIDFTYLYDNYLYDPDPVDTLTTLRDSNYWNILGVNYYLITHGEFKDEEKNKLYLDLLDNFLNRNDISDEESLMVLEIGFNNLSNKEILEDAIKKWSNSSNSLESKYNSLFLQSMILLENKENNKALELYNELEMEDETLSSDIIKHIYINKGFVLLKSNKFDNAEIVLREGWNRLRNKGYDKEFIGAIKRVLIEKNSY